MTIPNRFQTEKSGGKYKTVLNIVWTVFIHDPASDKAFLLHSRWFFPIKCLDFLNLLRILATSDHFWPLLTTFGHFWPLLATLWPLLAIFGHFWPLLATFGHFCWRINIPEKHYKRSKKKTIIWWEYNSQAWQKNHATNQSINRSKAVIVWRSEAIRNSEFDWTSSAVHGKGFRGCGLTDPWGHDGTVLLKNSSKHFPAKFLLNGRKIFQKKFSFWKIQEKFRKIRTKKTKIKVIIQKCFLDVKYSTILLQVLEFSPINFLAETWVENGRLKLVFWFKAKKNGNFFNLDQSTGKDLVSLAAVCQSALADDCSSRRGSERPTTCCTACSVAPPVEAPQNGRCDGRPADGVVVSRTLLSGAVPSRSAVRILSKYVISASVSTELLHTSRFVLG